MVTHTHTSSITFTHFPLDTLALRYSREAFVRANVKAQAALKLDTFNPKTTREGNSELNPHTIGEPLSQCRPHKHTSHDSTAMSALFSPDSGTP